MRQRDPIRTQHSIESARQTTPSPAAAHLSAVHDGSRANSGTAQGPALRVAAWYGSVTHATTSGTQTTHMMRSSPWRGTTPGCFRVFRRTRTIMTPTPNQYAQIVAVSTAAEKSCIERRRPLAGG